MVGVGAQTDSASGPVPLLIQFVARARRKLAGSAIGSPAEMGDMFQLEPRVEKRPIKDANQAIVDMEAGKPCFRHVLVNHLDCLRHPGLPAPTMSSPACRVRAELTRCHSADGRVDCTRRHATSISCLRGLWQRTYTMYSLLARCHSLPMVSRREPATTPHTILRDEVQGRVSWMVDTARCQLFTACVLQLIYIFHHIILCSAYIIKNSGWSLIWCCRPGSRSLTQGRVQRWLA